MSRPLSQRSGDPRGPGGDNFESIPMSAGGPYGRRLSGATLVVSFPTESTGSFDKLPLASGSDDESPDLRRLLNPTEGFAPTTEDTASTNLGTAANSPRPKGFWLIIVAILFCTFVGALDLCSISTVLPTIAKDLNANSYIWVSNAYMLTSVAFIPTASSLANIFGRRPTMLGALFLFGAGSAVCGAAPSMNVLIIGRSIAGVGSGALMALCQIVLADLTSLADRGTFLGLSGLVYSLAAVFGPLIGGGFAIGGNWRWLFYINIPIVGIAATLCGLFLKVKVPPGTLKQKFGRLDWVNIIFIAASAACILGLSFGGATYSWQSWRTLVPLCVGGAGMVLWLFLENLIKHPTVPWEILRHRTSLAGYVQTFLQGVVQLCYLFYLTTWFQSVKGSSALRSAVQTFSLSFTVAPFAIANGIWVKKTQSFVNPCIIAWVILTVGSGVMCLLQPSSPVGVWAVMPAISGVGLGILGTGVNFAVMAPLPPKLQPHAAGFFILVRTFGQLIGVTISSTVFQNELKRKVPLAWVATLPDPSEVAFSAIPLIASLGEPLRTQVRQAFSDSIQVLWLVCIGFSALGLASSLLMERLKLSTGTNDEYGIQDEKVKQEGFEA